MIFFPNAKINIGLDVTARRPDGYHQIETLMFPVAGLCDVLEIVPAGEFSFARTGLALDSPEANDLCVRAYEAMRSEFGVPPVAMRLHKQIPAGAGLGGGSADAAAVVKGLGQLFGLGLDEARMCTIAARLGSDVPFFVRNVPQIARGRGEILENYPLSLSGYKLMVVKPEISVSTAEAYAGVIPYKPEMPLTERLAAGIGSWKGGVANVFEPSVFAKYPQIGEIKEKMYRAGALYASMSGSGSAVYGIFDPSARLPVFPCDTFVYQKIIG